MILLKMAFRNVFRHRLRSVATLFAIAFGCVAITFAGAFFEEIFFKMRESYINSHTGHIQVYRRGYLEKGATDPFSYLIENPQALQEKLRKIDEVYYATPRLMFSGLLSTGETTASVIAAAVDPDTERVLPLLDLEEIRIRDRSPRTSGAAVLMEGENLISDGQGEILLGIGLASSIGAKPGDSLVLMTNTVAGSINAADVVVKGIFRSSSKEYDDRAIRMSVDAGRSLLGTTGAQSLIVVLNDTKDTAAVQARIQQIIDIEQLDLELKSWNELNDFYVKTHQLFNAFFQVIIFIVSCVVVLSIFNTMSMSVMERTTEIGTIMALGTRRRQVIHIFLIEGLVLGIVGGLLGIVVGAGVVELSAWIGITMPPPPGATMTWIAEPKMAPPKMVLALVLAILSATISAILPAWKGSRLQISDALRFVS